MTHAYTWVIFYCLTKTKFCRILLRETKIITCVIIKKITVLFTQKGEKMNTEKSTEKKLIDEAERGNYGGAITAIVVLSLIIGIIGGIIWFSYKH